MRLVIGVLLGVLAAIPAQAQSFATYRCADGTVLPVEFYDDTRSANVQLDGKALRLPRKLLSVSGARYAKAGVDLRIGRDRISLKRKGQRWTACTAG